MLSSKQLTELFFHDLKSYNSTNFKSLEKANLDKCTPEIHKAFSSVITRYFIFSERRPELTLEEKRLLYFKLKIDMIGKYFEDYPDANIDLLKAFQIELRQYVSENKNKPKSEAGDIDGTTI